MATKTTTTRGFQDIRCPKCGEADVVTVALFDLQTFSCSSCSEEFTADDVRAMIAGWERVLAWVALAPVRD